MLIGGIQKLSLLDFPKKMAATVFTQGCPFRCHYCHNAELVLPDKFDKTIPEEDLFDFLKTRIGKLDAVVISGGEPTIQPGLSRFIKKIKDMGFLVKLDTSGIDPEKLSELIEKNLLDYIAMDFKAPYNKYPSVIGVNIDTDKIRRSVDIILKSSIAHEFRTTITDTLLTLDDLIEISTCIKGADLFALQRFISSSTLNSEYINSTCFGDEVLLSLKNEIEKSVKTCIIR